MRPSTGLFDTGGQRLSTSPIRGRAGELTVIGALIAAVAQGGGGVLVIEGPPGIGKSRLLTEVLALAEKAGVRALFGEAFEYQQTVPFFSLFMATLCADPPVCDAEALRRLGTSADLGYWVVHDLQAAIHAAPSRIPLAILLEDIHWADNATLLASRSLAATRPDAPVNEEGRLDVSGGRAVATGDTLPRRLSESMQQRLDQLSNAASQVVQVAAVLPDRFSARLLAAMLERRPAALVSAGSAREHVSGSPYSSNPLQ